jgi:cystinosin
MATSPRNRLGHTTTLTTSTHGNACIDDDDGAESQTTMTTTTATTPLLLLAVSTTAERAADDDEGNGASSRQRRTSAPQRLVRHLLAPFAGDDQDSCPSIVSGLSLLLLCGTILGLLLQQSSSASSTQKFHGHLYPAVSSCIGWTYVLCWSVSFYPQVVANFRRRTTAGLSPDFAVLNVLGFAFYATYTIGLYANPAVRHQYRHRHQQHSSDGDGGGVQEDIAIPVQRNDVAFAVHALVLASLTLAQIGYYDGFLASSASARQKPSRAILGVVLVACCIVVAYPAAMLLFGTGSGLDYLYLLSSIKIMISVVKYVPQVLLNAKRKSTVGWSIWQILLDAAGGTLSDVQLILDCWNMGDWTGITGNGAKLALGSVSIVFDVIFMVQHYVLYPAPRRRGSGPVPTSTTGSRIQEEDAALDNDEFVGSVDATADVAESLTV